MRSIRSLVSRATSRRQESPEAARPAAGPAPSDAAPLAAAPSDAAKDSAPSALVEAVQRAGRDLTKADKAFLRALDERLRGLERPVVAVLGSGRGGWLPRAVVKAHPEAHVVRLDVAELDRSELHARLAAAGPFDVIIENTRQGRPRIRRIRDVFFHLRPGGALMVRDIRPKPGGKKQPTDKDDVALLVAALDRWKSASDSEHHDGPGADDLSFADSVASSVVRARHAVLENSASGLAKLREHETDTVLELRPDLGRVLEQRPPVELASRCDLRLSSGERAKNMPTVYDVPAVSLREYHDVVCHPGQVVTRDNLLLPDTYRHNQKPRLKNLYTQELSPLFARLRDDLSGTEPQRIEGPHFYLDSEFRGHFGHAMTEVMSRLWAWPAAKRAEPRLKALMCVNKGRDLAGWEATLFAAAGIDRDDIVVASGPVEVEKLLAATPMFSMPAYVHPDIAETWATVGRELAAQAPDREYPKRVFCARRPGKRPCHNAAEVEALFAGHGFEVIYPEDFPLPEQARIFREAEVIAGFAGSGLFSTCLSDSPKRVIMLSPASYTARNEYMIAAVLGHELDLVLSEPDPSYTGHYWESGFTFDFEREGVFLRDVLSAL